VEKNNALNGWKEIANYLRLGVRTVQRYEKNFDLPVRRLAGKPRSLVFAITQEIDGWRQTALVPKRAAEAAADNETTEPARSSDNGQSASVEDVTREMD